MTSGIRVEAIPTRYPGTCSSCGAASSSPRKWFLDTGCDEKGDLTVFAIIFCDACFDVLASAAGYVKRGEEVEYYLKRVQELEEQVDNLESIRIAVDSIGINTDRLIAFSRFDLVDLESEREADSKIRIKTKRGKPSMDSGESGLSESSDGEELARVRPSKNQLDLNI